MDKISEIKEKVGNIVREKGLNVTSISVQLGKNPSYLQKFIKEKYPKRLEEEFRKKLAIVLNIDEQELTDRPLSSPLLPAHMTGIQAVADSITGLFKKKDSVSIAILDVTACCGSGIDNFEENIIGQWNMPLMEYRTISTTSNPDNVKMIRARGDSMAPTLKDGDWVLADMSFRSTDSDGLYLIRSSTGLAIKRLQGSIPGHICIISDNPKYPPQTWESGEIQILGKIIYTLSAEKVG